MRKDTINFALGELEYLENRTKTLYIDNVEEIARWKDIILALRRQPELANQISQVKEKIEQLRRDYKSLDSAEHVVMDYVANTILKILEEEHDKL